MNIDYERVAKRLQNAPIGHTIHHYPSIASTMETARVLAADSCTRSGTVVLAEEQSRGRGRLQREWIAPYGTALLMTVIVTPPLFACPFYCLPMLLAVAVIEAIEETIPQLSEKVKLKWPNDILLGDPPHSQKIAGLLIETIYESIPAHLAQTIPYALLGVGINVNQTRSELPATQAGKPQPGSLHIHCGHPIEREQLLANFCKILGRWLTDAPAYSEHDRRFVNIESHIDTEYTERIYQTWRNRLCTLGQSVIFEQNLCGNTNRYAGTAIDVTSEGALVIQDKSGQCHTFNAGDITLHKHV